MYVTVVQTTRVGGGHSVVHRFIFYLFFKPSRIACIIPCIRDTIDRHRHIGTDRRPHDRLFQIAEVDATETTGRIPSSHCRKPIFL